MQKEKLYKRSFINPSNYIKIKGRGEVGLAWIKSVMYYGREFSLHKRNRKELPDYCRILVPSCWFASTLFWVVLQTEGWLVKKKKKKRLVKKNERICKSYNTLSLGIILVSWILWNQAFRVYKLDFPSSPLIPAMQLSVMSWAWIKRLRELTFAPNFPNLAA